MRRAALQALEGAAAGGRGPTLTRVQVLQLLAQQLVLGVIKGLHVFKERLKGE